MGFLYSLYCSLNCHGESDYRDVNFSGASSRQQFLIMQQLRESQRMKDASPGKKSKCKVQKVVPLAVSVSPKKLPVGNRGVGHTTERARLKEERMAQKAARNIVEETNLKSALTHPTILMFLRAFMVAQSTDNMLDFYLDVTEIRGLHRRRYNKGMNANIILLHQFRLSLYRRNHYYVKEI